MSSAGPGKPARTWFIDPMEHSSMYRPSGRCTAWSEERAAVISRHRHLVRVIEADVFNEVIEALKKEVTYQQRENERLIKELAESNRWRDERAAVMKSALERIRHRGWITEDLDTRKNLGDYANDALKECQARESDAK